MRSSEVTNQLAEICTGMDTILVLVRGDQCGVVTRAQIKEPPDKPLILPAVNINQGKLHNS